MQESFKAYLLDNANIVKEVRRLKYMRDNSFAAFKSVVVHVFASLKGREDDVELFWKDSDGDLITVSSDDELELALYEMTKGPDPSFKIYLKLVDKDEQYVPEQKKVKETVEVSKQNVSMKETEKSAPVEVSNKNVSTKRMDDVPQKNLTDVPKLNEATANQPRTDSGSEAGATPNLSNFELWFGDQISSICDGCETSITRSMERYRCATCDDYDLCGACKKTGVIHTEHEFNRIVYDPQDLYGSFSPYLTEIDRQLSEVRINAYTAFRPTAAYRTLGDRFIDNIKCMLMIVECMVGMTRTSGGVTNGQSMKVMLMKLANKLMKILGELNALMTSCNEGRRFGLRSVTENEATFLRVCKKSVARILQILDGIRVDMTNELQQQTVGIESALLPQLSSIVNEVESTLGDLCVDTMQSLKNDVSSCGAIAADRVAAAVAAANQASSFINTFVESIPVEINLTKNSNQSDERNKNNEAKERNDGAQGSGKDDNKSSNSETSSDQNSVPNLQETFETLGATVHSAAAATANHAASVIEKVVGHAEREFSRRHKKHCRIRPWSRFARHGGGRYEFSMFDPMFADDSPTDSNAGTANSTCTNTQTTNATTSNVESENPTAPVDNGAGCGGSTSFENNNAASVNENPVNTGAETLYPTAPPNVEENGTVTDSIYEKLMLLLSMGFDNDIQQMELLLKKYNGCLEAVCDELLNTRN